MRDPREPRDPQEEHDRVIEQGGSVNEAMDAYDEAEGDEEADVIGQLISTDD